MAMCLPFLPLGFGYIRFHEAVVKPIAVLAKIIQYISYMIIYSS